jgi:hypothetical protein
MKNFKDIKKQVGLNESGEHTFGGGVQAPSGPAREISAASDEGVYYIQRNSQLNRINAFLDAFSRKEYIDPRGALGMLRAKLNIAGLDFDFNKETCFSDEGISKFRITRFGGAFGKTPFTPFDQFDDTDGISEFNDGKGFSLVVTIGPSANGTYRIDTKIVEEGPELEPDIDM